MDRALIRAGVREDVARIVAATPALRVSWLLGALGAALFAVWGDNGDPRLISVVLVLAPVVPVAGVAAAYGPWADPMYETTQATPSSGFRVLLLRSIAVLLGSGVLLSVASIAVPGAGISAVAWILPSLALSATSLMLATFIPLTRAAVLVGTAWLSLAAAISTTASAASLYRGWAQVGFFGVAVSCSLVVGRRRHRLEIANLRTRRALVDAGDVERRRIERNLHDGAQQQLVAIGVKAGLARALVSKDPARATEIIDQIRADAQEALDGLREMTRGTCPPILADEGLAAALAFKATRSPVPVELHAEEVDRAPRSVEIAAYFCCLEAIQNAAKYARASSVVVSVRTHASDLSFAIRDDGVGFEPSAVRKGVGMRSMVERVESLGGEIDVRSSPGRGTTVSGRIPIRIPASRV